MASMNGSGAANLGRPPAGRYRRAARRSGALAAGEAARLGPALPPVSTSRDRMTSTPSATDPDLQPRRARQAVRSVPPVVWLLTGLHVAIMATYSFLYLPYTNPDEAQHEDMVMAWHDGDGLARPTERTLSAGVGNGAARSLRAFFQHPYADDEVVPRGERPTFAELGGLDPFAGDEVTRRIAVGEPFPNQMTQHPPLYYASLAGLLAVTPGADGLAWDQTVGYLRLVNVAMLAPLPLLAWAAARPLARSPAVPVLAATVPLLLPGVSRIGGTINNDNLLILLSGIVMALAVRVCVGHLGLRLAVTIGAVTGLALLTKGFALVLPLVVAGSYPVAWRRERQQEGIAVPWRPALAALGVAFAVGGWWWVRNLVLHGRVQPGGFGPEARARMRPPVVPDSVNRNPVEFVDGFTAEMSRRIVAWLGLVEPPYFPFRLAFVIMVLIAAGVVLAMVLRRSEVPRGIAVVCVVLPVAILAIVAQGSFRNWWRYQVFNGVQGRYLYAGVVGVAMVAAAGWTASVRPRARPWLPLGSLAIAGVAQAVAAAIVLDTFWMPPDPGGLAVLDLEHGLAALARWSPWPMGLTAMPLLAVALLGSASAVACVRFALRSDREPADRAPA